MQNNLKNQLAPDFDDYIPDPNFVELNEEELSKMSKSALSNYFKKLLLQNRSQRSIIANNDTAFWQKFYPTIDKQFRVDNDVISSKNIFDCNVSKFGNCLLLIINAPPSPHIIFLVS